jgi:hypothetical protein
MSTGALCAIQFSFFIMPFTQFNYFSRAELLAPNTVNCKEEILLDKITLLKEILEY